MAWAGRVFRYRVPLVRSVQVGDARLCAREGLLVHSDDGWWGEAAPLPGLSRESLTDVLDELKSGPPCASPSLQFAWSAAARQPWGKGRVPVAALLQGTTEQILLKAHTVAHSSFQAAKLKVGRNADVAKDAELVRTVRHILRSNQRLRLDANRAWSWDQAVAFARSIEGMDVEYVEEPLRDAERLEDFVLCTGCRYALDETLRDDCDLSAFRHAAAFVVKPTLLGGHDVLDQLAEYGIPLVFSACYESGVGILSIAGLANEYSPNVPAGIDTYDWLAEDVLEQRLELSSSYVELRHEVALDESRLLEVDCR